MIIVNTDMLRFVSRSLVFKSLYYPYCFVFSFLTFVGQLHLLLSINRKGIFIQANKHCHSSEHAYNNTNGVSRVRWNFH